MTVEDGHEPGRSIVAPIGILITTILVGVIALPVALVLRLDGAGVPPVARVLPLIFVVQLAFGGALLLSVMRLSSSARRRFWWWAASTAAVLAAIAHATLASALSGRAMAVAGIALISLTLTGFGIHTRWRREEGR